MDKKLKNKWVAALRSGKYKQAKQQLTYGGGYCCLGVLCEVLNRKIDERESTITVSEAKRYFGLENKAADAMKNKFERMNDFEGKSFDEIADYIEKNL